MTIEERLAEQLDAKDSAIDELNAKVERLERELEGALDGWRRSVDLVDDPSLPLPRLELVYEQVRGWSDYRVHYRLVLRHLLGDVYALPISYTKIGGGGSPPEPDHLPFRDGCHAAHDAAFLALPCYKILPGRAPERIDWSEYASQSQKGREHRRTTP